MVGENTLFFQIGCLYYKVEKTPKFVLVFLKI